MRAGSDEGACRARAPGGLRISLSLRGGEPEASRRRNPVECAGIASAPSLCSVPRNGMGMSESLQPACGGSRNDSKRPGASPAPTPAAARPKRRRVVCRGGPCGRPSRVRRHCEKASRRRADDAISSRSPGLLRPPRCARGLAMTRGRIGLLRRACGGSRNDSKRPGATPTPRRLRRDEAGVPCTSWLGAGCIPFASADVAWPGVAPPGDGRGCGRVRCRWCGRVRGPRGSASECGVWRER